MMVQDSSNLNYSVHPPPAPPPGCAGGGWDSYQIFLTGFNPEGVAGKEGGDFFQGVEGAVFT